MKKTLPNYLLTFSTITSLLSASFSIPSHAADKEIQTQRQDVHDKVQEYHHFFDSKIFDNYQEQLKTWLRKELNDPSLSNCLGLQNPLSIKFSNFIESVHKQAVTYQEKRSLHEKIILQLRDLIRYKDHEMKDAAPLISAIHRLCQWIYSEVNLMPAFQEFLDETIPTCFNEDHLKKNSLISLLNCFQFALEGHPKLYGSYKAKHHHRDLHYAGYLFSKTFVCNQVQFILMPRIVMKNRLTNAKEIHPEFLVYLESLKSQGKTHLYINLMNRTGSEREDCLLIERLSQQEDYKNVLQVASLCKTSSFYWQKDSYSNINSAAEFKQAFMADLFCPSSSHANYKWPDKLDATLWTNACQDILNTVHSKHFADKESLSVAERQDFIEIALGAIVNALSDHLHPDHANISCKYTMDRGPSLLTLFYIYNLSLSQNSLTAENKCTALTLFFAPPVLSHNRAPHDYFKARLSSACERLLDKSH